MYCRMGWIGCHILLVAQMKFNFLACFCMFLQSLHLFNRYVKHFQMLEILFLVLHNTINLPFLESDFNDYDENAKNSYLTGNSCAKCEEKFDNLMDLAVHFNKKHDQVNNRPQCPVCPESFKQISHLKYHVNVTHLKRYQGQKKRPLKTIGTVVFKSNY